MEWIQEKFFNLALNHFHKWYGLLSSILLTWILFLSIYKLLLPINDWFEYYLVGIVATSFVIIIAWAIYTYKFPSREENKIGLVVAVHIESREDYILYENDFLKPFKERISNLKSLFHVMPLKNHQSESIIDEEDARRILKKTNAQFIVWGSVKKRKKDSQYFFNLRAMVVHSPIDEVKKIVLINDFNALLPNKIAFENNFQPEAFDFRANQLFVAVEYITGRAALLSGDAEIALQLHLSLYTKIKEGYVCPVNHKNLEKIISIEYAILADQVYINSNQSMSTDFINHVSNSLKFDGSNYSSLLKQAIIDFGDGRGDPRKSLKVIQKAQKCANGKEWLYSKTFLHFWLDDFPKALSECDRLEKKSFKNEDILVRQICEFNENLLLKFPDKLVLNYWLGFLHFVKLDNKTMAHKYFDLFKDSDDQKYSKLIEKSKIYLASIRQEIGY